MDTSRTRWSGVSSPPCGSAASTSRCWARTRWLHEEGARGHGGHGVTRGPWRRLAVVGVGLIGGSIARAVRARRLCETIVGVGRRRSALAPALAAGAIDLATDDLAEGVRGADLVVLCAPVGSLPGLVRAAWPHLGPGTLLTDAGRVKRGVVAAALACPPRPGVAFVGSHPM